MRHIIIVLFATVAAAKWSSGLRRKGDLGQRLRFRAQRRDHLLEQIYF